MSNLNDLDTPTMDVEYRRRVAELNPHQRRMLEELEEDFERARNALKPFLGLIPRRGHVWFAILPHDAQNFKTPHRVSKLVIDCDQVNEEVLKMLFDILRLKQIRANGLQQPKSSVKHFTYHIDLEAA